MKTRHRWNPPSKIEGGRLISRRVSETQHHAAHQAALQVRVLEHDVKTNRWPGPADERGLMAQPASEFLAQCSECSWVLAYLPMPAATLAKLISTAACPKGCSGQVVCGVLIVPPGYPDARADPAGDLGLIYGAREIAAEIGISRGNLYRLARQGKLPTFKVGNKLAARRSELRAFMSALGR
jgi:excisionase family DNA binding protein